MAKAGCFLESDDPKRNCGLVYLDRALASVRATHVLIAGVSSYQSPRFTRPLETATISARALADFFLGPCSPQFDNPHCALGSVAMLLSEKPGGVLSQYCGGDVPRADFATLKTAVRAWLDRINSNKDNIAVLYIAGHGHLFINRTAFMLEDYGLDTHDVTAGMAEVEQFITALQFAKPVYQLLLFDCCRNPTPASLPDFQDFGSKLISLTKSPEDHGEPRKQWVICSCSPGERASGLAKGPTLFNMALLDALGGVAADPSENGWPVRPGALVEKIDKLISLHRLPGEKAQTPAGRFGGGFELTFAGETDEVPVYIALDDPAEWPEATLTLAVDGQPREMVSGADGESPFVRRKLAQLSTVEVTARHGNTVIGTAKKKVQAPASFVEVVKQPLTTVTPGGPRDPTRVLGTKSQISIHVPFDMEIARGALIEVHTQSLHETGERPPPPLTLPVTLGGRTDAELDAGDYRIVLRTPDGRFQRQDVTLAPSQNIKLEFRGKASPHEWMAAAVAQGARYGAPSAMPIGINLEWIGSLDFDLKAQRDPNSGLSIIAGPSDGRFARFAIADLRPSRFIENELSAWVPPTFVRATGSDGREECAVIPSIGNQGWSVGGGWSPHLIVDHRAARSETMTTAAVEDRNWTSLIGFVGSRDFGAGSVLLDRGLDRGAIAAMRDKISNPLAAIAGSLIAVSVAAPDSTKFWDSWLANIANWFPGIPDGPIVLARRKLVAARTKEQIAEARRWFEAGFRRGIPYYSLSVDWLAQGLNSLPGDDEELRAMRTAAQRVSMRVDPTRAFTVVRVK